MTITAAQGVAGESRDAYWTTRELADHLKVSILTIRRWVRKGIIRAIALPSGQLRIPSSEVTRLTEGSDAEASAR